MPYRTNGTVLGERWEAARTKKKERKLNVWKIWAVGISNVCTFRKKNIRITQTPIKYLLKCMSVHLQYIYTNHKYTHSAHLYSNIACGRLGLVVRRACWNVRTPQKKQSVCVRYPRSRTCSMYCFIFRTYFSLLVCVYLWHTSCAPLFMVQDFIHFSFYFVRG